MSDPRYFHKLQKGKQARGVVARVIRKWTIYDTAGRNQPLHIGMVLADEKGEAIYAQILGELIEKKAALFEIGSVYMIKKFMVENSRKTYKSVDKPLMIDITEYTSAEVIQNPPAAIPEYIYNITPFSMIRPSTIVFNYTDVIGYLVKYNALNVFVPKNKEKAMMLREIYIKDLRENVMKVTLWGQHAAEFGINNIYNPQAGNLIVCLIVGCIPREDFKNKGDITLTASPAASYYFSPPIPEAAMLHSRFKNTPVFIERPADEDTAPPTVQDVQLPHKTIAELDKVDPFNEEEPGPFKCIVTVASILTTQNWWYIACKLCKKSSEQQFDGTYRCPKCQGTETVHRYSLPFMAADETGEARFFAYDDDAQKMIQSDCESIMNPLTMKDGLPQAIQNIINKKYTFSVDLSTDSCKTKKNRQYQVKAVLERPGTRTSTPITQTTPTSHHNDKGEASGTGIMSPQHRAEVLEIEAGTQSTPAPGAGGQESASKQAATRSPRTSPIARRNLFHHPDATDKDVHDNNVQIISDDPNTDLAPTDNTDPSMNPPRKRSEPSGDERASKSTRT